VRTFKEHLITSVQEEGDLWKDWGGFSPKRRMDQGNEAIGETEECGDKV